MASDTQDTEIPQDLQCLPRELLQSAVYHIKLLQSSIYAKKAVLLDQSQRSVDEPQHSNVQRIESGSIKTSFERNEIRILIVL